MTDSVIKSRLVADSIAPSGKRIRTYEVEFHRFVTPEYNTHRVLSKNAASTRAIPLLTQIDNIINSPALPVFYGKNQAGMVAEQELDPEAQEAAKEIILDMMRYCIHGVKKLNDLGLHKQTAGRYLEPWMTLKGVITGTEWENLFWLRHHKDAQPEFRFLAESMLKTANESTPILLKPGEWHVPYYFDGYWKEDKDGVDVHGFTLKEAIEISLSCCAQVSYRKLDDSLEKAKAVVSRLNLDSDTDPKHSSPAEHQATPMSEGYAVKDGKWEEGVTAYHKDLGKMSGNLAGWIQYRQLIPGHVKW